MSARMRVGVECQAFAGVSQNSLAFINITGFE